MFLHLGNVVINVKNVMKSAPASLSSEFYVDINVEVYTRFHALLLSSTMWWRKRVTQIVFTNK